MINICCSASHAGGATRRNSAITGDVLPREGEERRLSHCCAWQLSVMHRHRVNVSSPLLLSGTVKDLDHNTAELWKLKTCSPSECALPVNPFQDVPEEGCGRIKGRTISLKQIKPMSPIRAGGSLHCGARTGCTEPSTVLSPAGGTGHAQERLSSLTHAIRVSWLNAPTFCSAVNNSCSRAVGGIRFRQKGRTPISSSLNIHRLLFAGTMCGSNCKLKWSCVCWHL